MLRNAIELIQNMGFRYVAYRTRHELEKQTGVLKRRFPANPEYQEFVSLHDWKNLPVKFPQFNFEPSISETERISLQNRVEAFKKGRLIFFSSEEYEVKDWLTNPLTGYRYDATKHWSEIPDFSSDAGDIKYVWEKSRFTFLYDLIRYEVHFQEDQSELVFGEIDSWIAENPVNCGPNWRCSQEIALRVLNWTFALQYYKNYPALTAKRFAVIVHSIYQQMHHVAANIHFSRRTVRNNHALTETLTLYLIGLLYPFFPESSRWKKDGKRWFGQEIAYQIYEDGTFLQFSMNYHRTAVQLLTQAIQIAHLNGERWDEVVYDRARKSLNFLRACQDDTTGWLPNYGNNDGALFFPLSESHFRDFRPQLDALAESLNASPSLSVGAKTTVADGSYTFDQGGYYILRDADTVTFIRCGHYKDRPFQADNLHLDLWVDGKNILRDAGSYLYNTEARWTRYFAGTASHNTVMLGDYDQMRKGPRFIWYDWIKQSRADWMGSEEDEYVFEGQFAGFRHVGKDIVHRRRVTKGAGESSWFVEDWLENAPVELPMHQIWHPGDGFFENCLIKTFDQDNNELIPAQTEGWYSEKYGQKATTLRLVYTTPGRYLKTIIEIKKADS
ncbi:heparinase II/III family protein [Persicitalea jodogahamensis]|uniref:Heparinase n=1 Tax=Persicitalea jodogahamensis TaxID=402147 RepID=A0A8J3D7S2_9BACT|nr:alginate lyase family protein [Persicitalea jodogahamensis]GHB85678.1 hypothetical protein GCM10007390_46420 [Persicitalea jodogahamensis]